jgi:hypothetical protein
MGGIIFWAHNSKRGPTTGVTRQPHIFATRRGSPGVLQASNTFEGSCKYEKPLQNRYGLQMCYRQH